MDCYEVLGVQRNAKPSEIKKAYRNLVKQHHPDTGGSEDRFKEISQAYETLSDPDKRKDYDFKSNLNKGRGFNEFFHQFNGDFSNMFDNAFNQSAKGQNVRIRIQISVMDVFNGTTKYVESGSNKFNVKIPKGIHEGAQLTIKGKGLPHPVNSTAPNGDAILIINIMPDSELIVNGSDIWSEVTVPFYDMILGSEVLVENKVYKIKVKIPPNSHDGKILRIIGKGMPIYNTNDNGSLMLTLRASSIDLTEEQIEHIKKIKQLANA